MSAVRLRGMHALVEHDGSDAVAVEEPLEIRVDGEPLAVTMRTPGHDEELALGFLYGEGLIDGAARGRAAGRPRRQHRRGRRPAAARRRRAALLHDVARAACAARARSRRSPSTADALAADGLDDRPRAARRAARPARASPGFERTGGLHATGLFTPDGELRRRPRGRRAPQRDGQGRRLGAARGSSCRCTGTSSACQRPAVVRARPEGRGRGRAGARRRRRADLARGRAGRRTATSRSAGFARGDARERLRAERTVSADAAFRAACASCRSSGASPTGGWARPRASRATREGAARGSPGLKATESVCPYCAVGCGAGRLHARRRARRHRGQPELADQPGHALPEGLGVAPARPAARPPDEGPLPPPRRHRVGGPRPRARRWT